ncbi:MAG: hypothetical protein H0A75_03945 [Candidatus Methanofishera endochildressiae]|uniref:Uncharacterized protein n=1 Tax=Candidatus Methanofishera endochildressiae TaxID=2738884 RepID=A0A7Z0MNE2_9GAMM|nr:hypothetical protein [Candidatus Methanofishera endochildressiae]
MAYAAGVLQVAVFDTAFHQTMPAYAYQYAGPISGFGKKGGAVTFHGTPIFLSQNKPLLSLAAHWF